MNLAEFYAGLSYGKLKNLYIGSSGAGTIPDEKKAEVLHHLNAGMRTLHGKFPLLVKELVLRTYDTIGIYDLVPKYADSDPTVVTQKFITDTVEDPFLGDVLRVLNVYDELGEEVSIGNANDPASVFLPKFNKIQIPSAATGNGYFIIYQAYPQAIDGIDETVTLDLPDILLNPLENFIAARVLGAMNGQEHQVKSLEYMQSFNVECQDILDKDLLSTSQNDNRDKFEARGFV